MIVKGAVAIFKFLLEKNLRNTRFNAGSQRVLFRRTGWAVIGRSASGPRGGGKRGGGAAPVVCGGSGVNSEVGIRCLGGECTGAGREVLTGRNRGNAKAPTRSPVGRTHTRVGVGSAQCLRCLRACWRLVAPRMVMPGVVEVKYAPFLLSTTTKSKLSGVASGLTMQAALPVPSGFTV